jgi:hypothetical protein
MRYDIPSSSAICLTVLCVALLAPACGGDASVPPATADSKATASKPKDEATTQEIDRAVNDLYLDQKKPKEAEKELIGIIESCGNDCSPAVKARGWMYLGIVRGGGADDQAGARDAFERAVREDPKIRLDEALATPPTLQTFESVRSPD